MPCLDDVWVVVSFAKRLATTSCSIPSPSSVTAEEMKDKLNVYKCNVDEEPELAERFQIASIPTVILFKGTKVVHSLVGNMPKEELVSEIEAHL